MGQLFPAPGWSERSVLHRSQSVRTKTGRRRGSGINTSGRERTSSAPSLTAPQRAGVRSGTAAVRVAPGGGVGRRVRLAALCEPSTSSPGAAQPLGLRVSPVQGSSESFCSPSREPTCFSAASFSFFVFSLLTQHILLTENFANTDKYTRFPDEEKLQCPLRR